MNQNLLVVYRLSIGLAQGIWLYLLHEALDAKAWPATNSYIFAPLLAFGIFVPLIAISGLNNMRLRTLLIWLGVATILCGVLAFYDVYRLLYGEGVSERAIPFLAILSLTAVLFIAHTLIVAGEADRRWLASYPTHFDIGWKHSVQILLATLFLGVFWIILGLGAALFELINLTFVRTLIAKPEFFIPVTTVSFAYALHLTDTRTELVRGARTLLLLLLSWLLPVMALLVIGFLLALPFTGLDVLWDTRFASGLLLVASAALILLVNAVYQDGRSTAPTLLRYASLIVPVALVPLMALAAYALILRVMQYGWTPERVLLSALIFIAACYALGYSYAVLRSGLSLRGIEPVNIGTGIIIACLVLALSTPLADPFRISVASQIARLESGHITPEKLDYRFLRFETGRFGNEALMALAEKQEGAGAAEIAAKAKQAIAAKTPYNSFFDKPAAKQEPPPITKRLANITVLYPKGASFPVSLLEQDWTKSVAQHQLRCLLQDVKCDAALIDLDDDGKDEILLVSSLNETGIFKLRNSEWTYLGGLSNALCHGTSDILKMGRIETVAPLYKDIQVGGQRLSVSRTRECAP